MNEVKPRIAITMGDPAGIGPEVVIKAVSMPAVREICNPTIFGDKGVLCEAAMLMEESCPDIDALVANLTELDCCGIRVGRPVKEYGTAMIRYLQRAAGEVVAGRYEAIVTAPINKEAVTMAGFSFPGHTEFLAALTGTEDYVMMLGGSRLKVALVTRHEPVRKISGLLNSKKIYKTIRIVNEAMSNYFAIDRPRIGVSGLNPHAGEKGLFGDEEKNIILPAVERARMDGIQASLPMSPDTIFYKTVEKGEFDVVVCMYHDQGLIPLKLLHFNDGVNVTLGLPIIRTSVDHGTAYDIAWKGIASPASMIAAIEMAVKMYHERASRTLPA